MSVLVVAAHPDDEILGCGATMAALAGSGVTVRALILGTGLAARGKASDEAIRALRADATAASLAVGVEAPTCLDFPDNAFDSVPLLEIVKAVEDHLDNWKPATIYTHHGGDLNIDHRRTFQAVLTATRPGTSSVSTIYSFEVPSSTEWAFGRIDQPFRPNVFRSVTEGQLQAKLDAMRCYETESRKYPHPRSPMALQAIARKWGSTASVDFAEAFELVRWVF